MKPAQILRVFACGAICLLLVLTTHWNASAQENTAPEISRDSLLAAAREVIDSTPFCMVVTLDEMGAPRVRPMEPFPPGSDMTIWLGTNRYSRKVDDIKHNPTIVLSYLMPNAMGYVSVYGKAELVDEQAAKDKWWKPEWAGYYPDKKEYFLPIKVTPEKIEVINYMRGVTGDPHTWRAPTIEFGQ